MANIDAVFGFMFTDPKYADGVCFLFFYYLSFKWAYNKIIFLKLIARREKIRLQFKFKFKNKLSLYHEFYLR